MDLSKAFDMLNQNLLITKLEASGLSITSFRYIRTYLNQRLQRTGVKWVYENSKAASQSCS